MGTATTRGAGAAASDPGGNRRVGRANVPTGRAAHPVSITHTHHRRRGGLGVHHDNVARTYRRTLTVVNVRSGTAVSGRAARSDHEKSSALLPRTPAARRRIHSRTLADPATACMCITAPVRPSAITRLASVWPTPAIGWDAARAANPSSTCGSWTNFVGVRRVWSLFTHATAGGAELTLLRDYLDRAGPRLDTFEFEAAGEHPGMGAHAYLHDLRAAGPQEALAPFAVDLWPMACYGTMTP